VRIDRTADATEWAVPNSSWFQPLTPAIEAVRAAMLARGDAASLAWPGPEVLTRALAKDSGVVFERQAPRSRRRRAPRDEYRDNLYDTRIVRDGCVPTRDRSWHDVMNALVWATFPQSKRALHQRQQRLVVPATPGQSMARSRELDALALFDEGGLVVATARAEQPATESDWITWMERDEACSVVFGHAIYESLALGRRDPIASVVAVWGLDHAAMADRRACSEWLRAIDASLASVVASPASFAHPKVMQRLRVDASGRLLPANPV